MASAGGATPAALRAGCAAPFPLTCRRTSHPVSKNCVAANDWSVAGLAPYAAERADRMARLRFASALTDLLPPSVHPTAPAAAPGWGACWPPSRSWERP